jgi:signal peptidase
MLQTRIRAKTATGGFPDGWLNAAALIGVLTLAYWLANEVAPRLLDATARMYVAQPLIWGALGLLSWSFCGGRILVRGAGAMVAVAALAALVQIACLSLAGLLAGFGHSPYGHGATDYAGNAVYLVTLYFGSEMTRSALLSAGNRAFPRWSFALVVLLFAAASISPAQFKSAAGVEGAFEFAGLVAIPALAQSVVATYLVWAGGAAASFTYRLGIVAFFWFSPILPALNWPAFALTSTIAAALALVAARDLASGREEEHGDVSPAALALTAIVVILVWVDTGILGVKADFVSGISMEPTFGTGDIVVTRSVDPNTLVVGDVVRFHDHDRFVVHRIVALSETDAGRVFVTRGDNLDHADDPITDDQVKGEVILVLPEVAWPLIYARNAAEDAVSLLGR